MLHLLLLQTSATIVTYNSAFQLKAVYSKNRLGATESSSLKPPTVFSSRPPYTHEWIWSAVPDEDNTTFVRKPVMCDSQLSLLNIHSGLYLSTKTGGSGVDMHLSPFGFDAASRWVLKCRNETRWVEDGEVVLQNVLNHCYLSTSVRDHIEGTTGRFKVRCAPISPDAVWRVSEGVFFPETYEIQEDY